MMTRASRSEFVPRLVALVVVIAFAATMVFGIARTEAHVRAVSLMNANGPATVTRGAPAARGGADLAEAVADTRSAHRTAAYTAAPQTAGVSQVISVPVTLRNLGDDTWDAGVRLAYHLYDASGALIAWDGVRSELPRELQPGEAETVDLRIGTPWLTGAYTVRPDLVRDGVGWFSSRGEAPAGSFALKVIADLDADYGATTAPATMVPGAEIPVQVPLENDGVFTWRAGGAHPVHLSYHWVDEGGTTVEWDGPRQPLPFDVVPGSGAMVAVAVRAPQRPGQYRLVWDMVEEGIGWFSDHGVRTRTDLVTVSDDVTLYGKGWGHGIGLSQWGAQGWAEGVTGARLTGEQIVAQYFPLAKLDTQPATKPFRVLLSAPSTGCVSRTIYSVAQMSSPGGMRLVLEGDPSVVYLDTAPDQPVRFTISGDAKLVATDVWSGAVVFADPDLSLRLVPKQWWDPIEIREKGLAYRGDLVVQMRDEGNLRVVNYVKADDYMMGALPGEMPSYWEMEALRAQAITARTYAAWRQGTAGDRTWDVRDDTADQCYGGHSFESPRTNAAVASTADRILTYDGQPIRALYSSADGGATENVGCVLDAERVDDTWRCAAGWPYLGVTIDPAEALAYDKRGPMPHGLWAETFSGQEIRVLVADEYGVDIGGFISMGFNESPGGRPISVRLRGSLGTIDVKGDRFLRSVLGLKSTLVETRPF